MKAAAKQAKIIGVVGVADVSGSQFRRLQAHLLQIGERSHQSIPAVLHHKAADVHRFICLRLETLTPGVSGHKHTPSLAKIKVCQKHLNRPYLVQKTLFANVIQYHCTRNWFCNGNNTTRGSHLSHLQALQVARKNFSPAARFVLTVHMLGPTHTMLLLSEGKPALRGEASAAQTSLLRENSEVCSRGKRKNKEISLCNVQTAGERRRRRRRRDYCKLFRLIPQPLWKFCHYSLCCCLKLKQHQG